jgi:hypothetical protein
MVLWRRAGVLVVAMVLALSLGATAGLAKKKRKGKSWSTTVTLTQTSSTQLSGKVGSKLAACYKARLVAVYFTDATTGQTQPLSVQRTDGTGHYRVNLVAPPFSGGYKTIVVKQRVRARKAPQTCKAAESPTVTVQQGPTVTVQ